jgi:hypothetical protein
MRGLLPIDEVCKSIEPVLWDAYAKARDDARDVHQMLERCKSLRFKLLSPRPDEERRLKACAAAKAALDTRVRGCLERDGYELWARFGSFEGPLKRTPIAAVGGLEFDYEKRTAAGEGLPPLFDAQIRLPPTAPVKRWRKPPPTGVLKSAALAVAQGYQPDDPPTAATWKEALEAHLGEQVTHAIARNALRDWAAHLRRQRGQKRNRRS